MFSLPQEGNERWNKLEAPDSKLYPWDEKSTYIKSPPFFEKMVSINHTMTFYCAMTYSHYMLTVSFSEMDVKWQIPLI